MEETKPFILPIDLEKIDKSAFKRCCVGCIILTQNHKILLQQRGKDWNSFPGCLATFGGTIESGESPIQALIRELKEELGAKVDPNDVLFLGAITDEATDHRDLIFGYFWHDRDGTITGCYEGEPRFYDNFAAALAHPKIMNDDRWLLEECKKLRLIK